MNVKTDYGCIQIDGLTIIVTGDHPNIIGEISHDLCEAGCQDIFDVIVEKDMQIALSSEPCKYSPHIEQMASYLCTLYGEERSQFCPVNINDQRVLSEQWINLQELAVLLRKSGTEEHPAIIEPRYHMCGALWKCFIETICRAVKDGFQCILYVSSTLVIRLLEAYMFKYDIVEKCSFYLLEKEGYKPLKLRVINHLNTDDLYDIELSLDYWMESSDWDYIRYKQEWSKKHSTT